MEKVWGLPYEKYNMICVTFRFQRENGWYRVDFFSFPFFLFFLQGRQFTRYFSYLNEDILLYSRNLVWINNMRPYNQFDLLGKRKASVGNDYFNQSRIFMVKASSELGNEKRVEKKKKENETGV